MSRLRVREYIYAARDRLDEHYDAVRAVRDRRFPYIRNFRTGIPPYLDVAYRRQMGVMQELLRLREEGRLDPVQALWFRQPRAEEELYDTWADPHSEKDAVWSMWPGGVQPETAIPALSWRDGRVEIECPTPGAAVAHQVDGSGLRPDHWLLYTGPFEARSGSTVTATAIRVGYAQSAIVELVVPRTLVGENDGSAAFDDNSWIV